MIKALKKLFERLREEPRVKGSTSFVVMIDPRSMNVQQTLKKVIDRNPIYTKCVEIEPKAGCRIFRLSE